MRTERRARSAGLEAAGTFMLIASLGCSADASSEPIVGSGHVVDSTTPAEVVQKVSISLPFRGEVFNGDPSVLLVRGEDNLIDQIAVEQGAAGEWTISAPEDLAFEQHVDMTIAIPYGGMVMLSLDGDDLVLMERPERFWRD